MQQRLGGCHNYKDDNTDESFCSHFLIYNVDSGKGFVELLVASYFIISLI